MRTAPSLYAGPSLTVDVTETPIDLGLALKAPQRFSEKPRAPPVRFIQGPDSGVQETAHRRLGEFRADRHIREFIQQFLGGNRFVAADKEPRKCAAGRTAGRNRTVGSPGKS